MTLVLCLAAIFMWGCSSGTGEKGPKTLPVPNKNVSMPPTPGPTIIPSETGKGLGNVNEDDDQNSETEASEGTGEPFVEEPKNLVVVLDPGHGGSFTGAIYFGNYEKNLTLSVANYIREYLTEHYDGVEVYLTRENDIALDPDLKIELEQRAVIAKEHDADYFVSLHFNASEAHTLNGVTVYASFRDNVAEKSQGIANSILEQLVALGLKNNNVKTRVSQDYFAEDGSRLDYYAVIRHNSLRDIPAVIVEHCFMDNEIDKEFMDTDEKLKTLAEADAKGIAGYLGLKEKE